MYFFFLIRCFCLLISTEYHSHYLLLLTFFFFMRVDNSRKKKKAVSSSLINHWKTHKQDSFLRQICIISERQETLSFYVFVLKFSPRCSFLIPFFFLFFSVFVNHSVSINHSYASFLESGRGTTCVRMIHSSVQGHWWRGGVWWRRGKALMSCELLNEVRTHSPRCFYDPPPLALSLTNVPPLRQREERFWEWVSF